MTIATPIKVDTYAFTSAATSGDASIVSRYIEWDRRNRLRIAQEQEAMYFGFSLGGEYLAPRCVPKGGF
ncbi:hypothetical protein SAMN02745126_04024 [Enhydrobacter aerosaccus]|uniref:Uncharacterized protein n=1 Tax=Enhydrobacter aerosaccus TaxID=225324 RepID=A0A1T4RQ45_9HYPH|nr:hypothetical protein [Enhydrobacter aerosaccus]SKA18119.1 hypothetical protein SAMN02745126_04024 [Enhydrobacter aerosaccus]